MFTLLKTKPVRCGEIGLCGNKNIFLFWFDSWSDTANIYSSYFAKCSLLHGHSVKDKVETRQSNDKDLTGFNVIYIEPLRIFKTLFNEPYISYFCYKVRSEAVLNGDFGNRICLKYCSRWVPISISPWNYLSNRFSSTASVLWLIAFVNGDVGETAHWNVAVLFTIILIIPDYGA